MNILTQLFFAFIQVGMFSVGGGYAAIPLIQNQIVDIHGLMTLAEFTDLITIAEMTPGPIAVNFATFVGIHIAGIPGALIATAGCILPSCIIVLALAHLYFKYRNFLFLKGVMQGLRPAVVGMIASAGLSILLLALFGSGSGRPSFAQLDPVALCLFAAALFVLRKWKKSPILILAGAGVAGLLLYQLV